MGLCTLETFAASSFLDRKATDPSRRAAHLPPRMSENDFGRSNLPQHLIAHQPEHGNTLPREVSRAATFPLHLCTRRGQPLVRGSKTLGTAGLSSRGPSLGAALKVQYLGACRSCPGCPRLLTGMARVGASALSGAGGLLCHGHGLTVGTAWRKMTYFGSAGGKEGLSRGADTCLGSPLP